MAKGTSNLRLFFQASKKGVEANSSNELQCESNSDKSSDVRFPLSPISQVARNNLTTANLVHSSGFPAKLEVTTPKGKKGVSQSKYPYLENVDNNVAFSVGILDKHSTPATPKSTAKRRFGWNPRDQVLNEQANPHSSTSTDKSEPRCAPPSTSRQLRDGPVEMNSLLLDSIPFTTPDHSAPAASNANSGLFSKMGIDAENVPGTPRNQPQIGTPNKISSRPGTSGAPNVSLLPSSMRAMGSVQRVMGSMPQAGKGASLRSTEPHFELQEDPSFWNDHNVQVLIRTRPLSSSEPAGQSFSRCLRQESANTLTWLGQPESRFTFDHVAGETISQEKLFSVAGLPMVENCMAGYNSCMFAYGQTGSGKTHTMLGDIDDLSHHPSDDRGMTPRIFEYLFAKICKKPGGVDKAKGLSMRIWQEEQERKQEQLEYVCKCSFLEIYNEQITDLLEPSSSNLQIREDSKKGVYVENLSEVEVKNVQDVMRLLVQGAANRKVAATNMNRESSRSHSVFACSVESKWESNSLTNIRFGRMNLVDLAGSERQKSSGAEGERLKEAANINKSLSTLGLVIMILVDVANGKQRHVPYRDSKLTFLLQDSLGGNSKTTVIATVSPANCNSLETLSTLKFAQRAKFIRNNAFINEDASGDVVALRREIQQLKEEVSRLRRESLSSMQWQGRYESDHEPGLSENSTNLSTSTRLKKIKDMEVLVAGAMRREQAADAATNRLAAKFEQLKSLVQQREQDAQCSKMILRFREDRIQRLESILEGKLSEDSYLTEEIKMLLEEVQLLRGRIDRNPELTRFAMDNIRLMEQLRGYQEFYDSGERETMVEETSYLRDQLLEVLDSKLALEEGAVAHTNAQADNYRRELEICCNDLSTCLEANAQMTRQLQEHQSQVGQLQIQCSEQQQEISLLQGSTGRVDELELERAVHLQIITDLKAQLQQVSWQSSSLHGSHIDEAPDCLQAS